MTLFGSVLGVALGMALLCGCAAPVRRPAPDHKGPLKIAAVVTAYFHNSHADVIVSRLLQTDTLDGKGREFALFEAQRPVHSLRSALWNDPDCDVRWCNQLLKAARGKRYKYIWSSIGDDKLFDIVKDPDERFNIIDRRPDIARKMFKQLEAKLLTFEQRYFPDTWSFRKYSSDLARRMEAWGLFQPMAGDEWATAKK